MSVRRAVVKVLAAPVVTLAAPATSIAADITVLCLTPLRHVMAALIPQFERATNHRVLITYGASPELKERIESRGSVWLLRSGQARRSPISGRPRR
jgi:ABC-type molybdate transport system substrate-binding protein